MRMYNLYDIALLFANNIYHLFLYVKSTCIDYADMYGVSFYHAEEGNSMT